MQTNRELSPVYAEYTLTNEVVENADSLALLELLAQERAEIRARLGVADLPVYGVIVGREKSPKSKGGQ